MNLIWKAAFAVGALSGTTTASDAADKQSRSETLKTGSKAYRYKNRQRCSQRCGGGDYGHYSDQDDHDDGYGDDGHDSHYDDEDDGDDGHYAGNGHGGHYGNGARYNRRVHGPRYRSRRAGYVYKYAGYWYSRKWWVPVRADSYGGRHLSHTEWCREQYGRYYNPYTNTYRASDGHHYKCIRP